MLFFSVFDIYLLNGNTENRKQCHQNNNFKKIIYHSRGNFSNIHNISMFLNSGTF